MSDRRPTKPKPSKKVIVDALNEPEQEDAVIGRALVGSLVVFALLGLVVGSVYFLTLPKKNEETIAADPIALPERRELPKVSVPIVKWTDITRVANIDFQHISGATGEKLLPETMGSGCAFLDYDNDGLQDIVLLNSCSWDPVKAKEGPSSIRLYHNKGQATFEDTTKVMGLAELRFYGMGLACGDFDNDGLVDVFVSCLGADTLLRNDGKQFVDVTSTAGVGGAEDAWSVSCGWFDYDRDGDLDLLVCHYIQWSRELDQAQHFRLLGNVRGYGRPQPFGGSYPSLFRNEGGGRFKDVSESSGMHVMNNDIQVPIAKSLGLVFEDFDDDGYLDFMVSNDTVQNFLFRNRGGVGFEEIGTQSGIAFDSSGAARGAMGIDAAAFRNDASLGVAIGNFANEMSALYVSRSRNLQFYDAAVANGLGPATRLELTFGVLFLDFDLDGRLDLFQANGHLESDIALVQASQHYEQSPQLFWNAGPQYSAEFLKCSENETGADFQKPLVGRGASYADIDNDGDLDLLITGCGQRARLLRNDQEQKNHWVKFKLVGNGVSSNRDAVGAAVKIRVGNLVQRRLVSATRSYLSQVELPVLFGLGSTAEIDSLSIRWPDGTTQEIEKPAIDQMHVINQASVSSGFQ